MFARNGYPDILYFLKDGDDENRLKYSLRSLKNLNHGRVFIVGYKPTWLDDRVEHISLEPGSAQRQGERNYWIAALKDSRVSDNFILMSSNFFVVGPTKHLPVFQNEKAPIHINKMKMLNLLEGLPNDLSAASIKASYTTHYNIKFDVIDDENEANDQQFILVSDETFNSETGSFLRKKFAKVLVFSHANDPDGLLSVILAQLAFAEVEYLLTNNPQAEILAYIDLNKNKLSEYDYIFISDIYPGKPVLKLLPNAYWFDHKQNSIDKIHQHELVLPNATITVELDGRPTSGSELFYRWLKENKLITDESDVFVEYIRQVDTWDFK